MARVQLTEHQLQLLLLIAREDLTLAQVAARLCRSKHTINKQVASIKKTLGTRTMAGSVYMAVERGLIEPDALLSLK